MLKYVRKYERNLKHVQYCVMKRAIVETAGYYYLIT